MALLNFGLFAWGAGAASVPVIIHLLNRRRFRVIDWAAMRFLHESVKRNRRRVRIEELILLALRCLAIFLLAVALGRFVGCAPPTAIALTPNVQTEHAFILDDSVSMGQRIDDGAVFARATNDLGEILAAIPRSDRLTVLLTSRPSDALFDPKTPLSDPEDLLNRLKALRPSDTRGDLPAAVETAGKFFTTTKVEKRLYILSDFRQHDVAMPDFAQALRQRLQALTGAGVKVVLMSYGAAPATNLTAEKLQGLSKLVIAGQKINVQLSVTNNGPARAENVSVSFTARTSRGMEVKLPAKTIESIDPGQTVEVQAACALPDAGPAVIQASLPADTLNGDNDQYLALDVRQFRKVLVVDGESDLSDPTVSESFFLVNAIDPNADGGYGSKVDVISPRQLAEADVNAYDVVVWANVDSVPPAPGEDPKDDYGQLTVLTNYLRGGGGLAIFLGDRVNPQFYNETLRRRERGLMAVALAAPVVVDRRSPDFVRLARDSISNDAVMSVFQGRRSQFTQFVRFYGYMPPTSEVPGVRTLARFDNERLGGQQSPAILVHNLGRGAVMLVCTSADTEWTDWPKDFTFVPFVNDMLDYLSRPGGGEFSAPVGTPVQYTGGADMDAARVTIQTPAFPAEDLVTLQTRRPGVQRSVSFDGTRHAGVYQLKLSVPPDEERTVLFARNVDAVEGRLTRAEEKDLRGALGVEFDYRDRLAKQAAEAATGGAEGREYWKVALAIMLALLAVEVFLGQRFGHYR